MKKALYILALMTLGVFAHSAAFADPTGKSGRSSTASNGCGKEGGCHASSVSSNVTLSLTSSSGSFTVKPGSTTTFTFEVAHATAKVGGAGIAVRTTQTGSTKYGTLAAGTGLRLTNGELVQSAAKLFSGGKVAFTFTWTAPTTEGVGYIQGIGNACNGNGVEDADDVWNWIAPVAITVSNGTSGVEVDASLTRSFGSYPNPANDAISFKFELERTGVAELSIVDMLGNTVKSFSQEASSPGMFFVQWDTRNESGVAVPTGAYRAVLKMGASIQTLPIRIVR